MTQIGCKDRAGEAGRNRRSRSTPLHSTVTPRHLAAERGASASHHSHTPPPASEQRFTMHPDSWSDLGGAGSHCRPLPEAVCVSCGRGSMPAWRCSRLSPGGARSSGLPIVLRAWPSCFCLTGLQCCAAWPRPFPAGRQRGSALRITDDWRPVGLPQVPN